MGLISVTTAGDVPASVRRRMTEREHDKVIAAVAKEALGPLQPGPGALKTLGVSSGVARTVKAIDTAERIRLDAEAIAYGFNRNHGFSWQLRRVGRGIAWGLDLTVLLAAADDADVGPVPRELTTAVRGHGLIPLTTERFT